MLSKYEPVVLAILVVGASILMENHHRIDMTRRDEPDRASPSVIAACQPGFKLPRLGIDSAAAAEGEATLLTFGDLDDVADACAMTDRNSSTATSADSVVR